MKHSILPLAVLALTLGGCAMKQKVMDVPMVSMTHYHLPAGAKLRETGPVSGRFCSATFDDKGSIGLFDRAIMAAQKQSQADFISNAAFFSEGSCLSIEGTGEKIVAEGTTSRAPRRSHRPRRRHTR